jgi:hypothetical protein
LNKAIFPSVKICKHIFASFTITIAIFYLFCILLIVLDVIE